MRALRWIAITVGSLFALVVFVGGVVYGLTERRISRHYEVTGHDVPTSEDSLTLARGEHVAVTRGCTGCHGADLSGQIFIDAPVVARLYAANLTRGQGGVATKYASTADWERAIRQGVAPDGRALLFMPSHEFYHIGDEDLGALIAYVRTRTAVEHEQGDQSVGPVGRGLFLAGLFHLIPAELIDHSAPRPSTPSAGATAEYGRYLAITCSGCHGETLSGGPIPGAPPEMAIPRNITPDRVTGLGAWTLADFTLALREGKRPDGSMLAKDMPIGMTSRLTDTEISAIWMYLQSVPAKTYGGR